MLKEINLAGSIHDIEDIPFALGSTCDVLRARSAKHNKSVVVKRIRGFLVQDASYAKVHYNLKLVRPHPISFCRL